MKTSQILTITAGTLLAAGVGYAVYFDYKRQNDPSFRKKLKKDSKKTSKAAKKQQQLDKKRIEEAVTEVVKSLQEPGALPTDPEAREKFFMEQVTAGETLITLGPSQHLAAATAFFKGIKIYPNPVDLIMIYQKATPEPVFNLIMEMVGKDAEMGGGRAPGGPSSDPLAALSGLAASAPSSAGQSLNLDEIDDAPSGSGSGSGSGAGTGAAPSQAAEASSAPASGPPSQASSQEWDKLSGTSLGQSQVDVATPSPTSAEGDSAEETGAGAGEETQDSCTPPSEPETAAPESESTPKTTAAAEESKETEKEETTETTTTTNQPEGQSPLPESKSEEEQKAFDFSTGSYTPSPLFKPEGQVEKEQGEAADAEEAAAAQSDAAQ